MNLSMFTLRRCSALHLQKPTSKLLAPQTLARCTQHGHAEKYRTLSTEASQASRSLPKLKSWVYVVPTTLLVVGGAGVLAYNYNQPFRHTALAVVRCSRIAGESCCREMCMGAKPFACRGCNTWCCRLQVDIRENVQLGGGTA